MNDPNHKNSIIAHVRPSDMAVQTNREHCEGVARIAAGFANDFGWGDVGYTMGLLHDKGKEQRAFQRYIRKMSGYEEVSGHIERTPHAFVGTLLATKTGAACDYIGMPIAGHHAGLYDWMDYEELKHKNIPEDINTDDSITNSVRMGCIPIPKFRHHLIRLLFSSLVDADYLDTEKFMQPEQSAERRCGDSLAVLQKSLDVYLDCLNKKAPDTPVNRIRNLVQQQCRDTMSRPSGFYSLTVPTGGGKTLSSMVWAIGHALANGKKRIIIAIPYTSIITQTAEVLRGIFGVNNVTEHHSAVNIKDEDSPNTGYSLKLATENWDSPIVITTNVQLFESIYASRPSKCRKLHNLCNSVLILDEVQALPVGHLQPIVDALKAYQEYFGLSVLFTTASMPALRGKYRGVTSKDGLEGIDNITEIIPDSFRLHDKLRRADIRFDAESSTYDSIAERILQHPRVLCIVNTRRDAHEIFSRLPQVGITIHLSKMMCPAHIRQQLGRLKEALKSPGNEIVRVVSTQLIEAGIDIDFPVVYRQEAGLDSILQAAGRCNREGFLPLGTTYVFSLTKERALPSGHLSRTASACKRLRITPETDCFAPGLMRKYFIQLYGRTESFDEGRALETNLIKRLLSDPRVMSFATAAQEFRLISDNSVNVIVNWDIAPELVSDLRENGASKTLLSKLAQYSIAVRKTDFDRLCQGALVKEILDGIWYMSDKEQYLSEIGLKIDNHWLEEILIR